MSKSKFWDGASESSDDEPKRPAVAKNRFALADSESESEWDSSSGSEDSDSSSSGSSASSDSNSSSGRSFGSSDESDSDSSSSSESESEHEGETEAQARERRSQRWLKDSDDEESSSSGEDERERRRERRAARHRAVKAESSSEESDAEVEPVKLEELQARVTECLKLRGKKGVDRAYVLSRLQACLNDLPNVHGASPAVIRVEEATIIAAVVSFHLDGSVGFVCLTRSTWSECTALVERLLALGKTHTDLVLREAEALEPSEARRRFCVQIAMAAELLDEDLYKALQLSDPTQPEVYTGLLSQVPRSIATLHAALEFFRTEKSAGLLVSKICLKVMEHLHYQSETSGVALLDKAGVPSRDLGLEKLLKSLAVEAASNGGLREKATAVLLLAFFAATRGELPLAKRLLTADMCEYLQTSEISTMVMFNRAVAAVGLGCFLAGDYQDCLYFLSELSGKSRELLAQCGSRGEKTAEQEKAEKRRQLPYCMHFDTELVEVAHFISAMLAEVPNMAGGKSRGSRAFRKFVEYYDRSFTAGPPENYKETLAVAGKALLAGDVDRALSLVGGLEIWERVDKEVNNRTMIQVRECALKTFLLTNLPVNEAYKIAQLGQLFGVEEERVVELVGGWILGGDLEAALLDETRRFVLAKKVKTNKLVFLASELADKITKLRDLSVEQH